MANIQYAKNIHTTKVCEKDGLQYITFEKFTQCGVRHGFTTRVGGISKGIYQSMNLSFQRGDDREAVYENHRRLANAIGYDEKRLVFSDQVHGTKILKVSETDCGKGIVRESDIVGIDGLITNVINVPLITFYADCVPLFFYDPVKRVVALAHSGWKGTVARIGRVMVETMQAEYGCRPSDIMAAIGPSICKKCYEISEDVALPFEKEFAQCKGESFLTNKGDGKYQLDLWKVNEYILLEAGITREHLAVTDLCTCCNSELFFSHRASKGKRGNLAAVIVLGNDEEIFSD